MRETKKKRKLRKGMNAATAMAHKKGCSPPVFKNMATPYQPAVYKKVMPGVPYVNPKNFGL